MTIEQDFSQCGSLSPATCGSVSPCSFDEQDLEDGHLPHIGADELPIFKIRSISPTGRSISPISLEENESFALFNVSLSPTKYEEGKRRDDFITLEEINAQIGTSPKNSKYSKLNLETIFEGVFLETPPKKNDTKRIALCKELAARSLAFTNTQYNNETCDNNFNFNELDDIVQRFNDSIVLSSDIVNNKIHSN